MRGSEGRSRRGWVAALVAASALLGARSAQAYCRSTTCDPKTETCTKDENGCPRVGAPLSWRELPLVYRFHAGGSDKIDRRAGRDAVRAAFDTWSSVACGAKRTSLRFQEGTDIPGSNPLASDGPAAVPFGIYFRDTVWPYNDAEESLALTNQTFGKVNGYIDYSDIEVNTSARDFASSDADAPGRIDLQAVITHEVGHYIGLAHSTIPTSIMVASYCASGDRCGSSIEDARALDADDIAAVCAMYPPSGISGVAYEDPAAKGCSTTSGSSSSPATFGMFAGLVLAFMARGRTRSCRRSSTPRTRAQSAAAPWERASSVRSCPGCASCPAAR